MRGAEAYKAVRMQRIHDLLQSSVDPKTLRQLFIRWIISQSLPLSVVECHEFRMFYKYSNAAANAALPNAHQTLHNWILNVYNIEKDRVQLQLQAALLSIHFTCDLWTSPNNLAILGIIAYFTDEDGRL